MNKKTTRIFFYFALAALLVFVIYSLTKKSEGFQMNASDQVCKTECQNASCVKYGEPEKDKYCMRIYYTNTRFCNVGDYRGEVYDSRNSSIRKDKNRPICIGAKFTKDVPNVKKFFFKRDMNARPEDCDTSKGELPYKYVDINGNDTDMPKNCLKLQPVIRGKECKITNTAIANGYVSAVKINSFSDVKDSLNRDICLVVREYPRN